MFGYVGLPALETIVTTGMKHEACGSSKEIDNVHEEICASDSPGMCCCVAVDIFRLFVLHTIDNSNTHHRVQLYWCYDVGLSIDRTSLHADSGCNCCDREC